jgi:hypothetical protein
MQRLDIAAQSLSPRHTHSLTIASESEIYIPPRATQNGRPQVRPRSHASPLSLFIPIDLSSPAQATHSSHSSPSISPRSSRSTPGPPRATHRIAHHQPTVSTALLLHHRHQIVTRAACMGAGTGDLGVEMGMGEIGWLGYRRLEIPGRRSRWVGRLGVVLV